VFKRLLPVLLLACTSASPDAQRFEYFPGGTYDAAVPTPASILGYEVGTYHTDYAGLERWLAALQKSDRVKVLRYGASEEKRPLYLVVITSPANLAKLEAIRAGMAKLADPRTTTDTEAARLVAELPAVAWMNHANDGNESAAFESAIQTSYQLAAGTDPVTTQILDKLVTIVAPAHNPESHERFVAWYNSVQVTAAGTADRQAAEHFAPWGMSTNNNHFQIDLNRDAFFQTQIETRQAAQAFAEWNPIVFVDHHGQTKNMFFPPPADAINLNVTPNQLDWMNRYGDEIGSAFDRHGWSYYRRGRFDLFYAGFWDSWPTLNGSVGMTFETDGGGSRGLAWTREDGTVLTLRDGVVHHHTGTMAVLKLTAANKEQRLRDFYQYKKTAIEEGQKENVKAVYLLPGRDEARVRELVALLQRQRIEVYRTTALTKVARAFGYFGGSAAAREAPAGAYIVPLGQPQKRLAKALLELEPGFTKEFLENERKKKERAELVGERPRDGFYDTTAWSLPLLFDVEAFWSESAVDVSSMTRVTSAAGPAGGAASQPARARYAYAFTSDSSAGMRVVTQLLGEGFNVAVATEPFTVANQPFPRGSIIARVERNPETLHARIDQLTSGGTEPAVFRLDSARVQSGADLGEDPVVELVKPRIAVITDEPTDDRSYGATWFTLERRLGYPFTALKTGMVRNADLSLYNIVVFPHGSPAAYHESLGEAGIARLRRWTQDGGTLVLIKGAAAMATRKGVEFTNSTLKRDQATVRLFFEQPSTAAQPQTGAAAGKSRTDDGATRQGTSRTPSSEFKAPNPEPRPFDGAQGRPEHVEGRAASPDPPLTRDIDLARTPGAILRVKVDPQHFLGFGYERDTAATVQSNLAFTISRTAQNAAAYPDASTLKLAGFMWPEVQSAMARTLFAWVEPTGRGNVILFADDPNFRATQLSTLRMFFNAVFLGPSFARRP
jgi:zinc carboxypeptidase